MKWSEEAWQSTKPVYEKILALPFIKRLINGTLPKETFLFYICQDAIYLSDYGKVLTGIASKLEDPGHIEAFIHFAGGTLAVEKVLHQSFMQELKSNGAIEPSPSCLLYTSFLQKQLANAPIEVALATVLPCFWVYKEVGDYILEHQTKDNNPYQKWIDTYGGEEFARSVISAIAICDEIAEQCTEDRKKAMTESFIISTKLEWLFWDSAYRQEQWPV
ncbi:thiaminase II [Proteiniphilum saccharofermentans]|uniref:thiaminase II n=1 Tax=Proteiniphilum saccharofermentans TaxID=1642647 RepID=UPI0028A5F5E4|nr:thiaminase II [Proteiniphilum saccharofermentans]